MNKSVMAHIGMVLVFAELNNEYFKQRNNHGESYKNIKPKRVTGIVKAKRIKKRKGSN